MLALPGTTGPFGLMPWIFPNGRGRLTSATAGPAVLGRRRPGVAAEGCHEMLGRGVPEVSGDHRDRQVGLG